MKNGARNPAGTIRGREPGGHREGTKDHDLGPEGGNATEVGPVPTKRGNIGKKVGVIPTAKAGVGPTEGETDLDPRKKVSPRAIVSPGEIPTPKKGP